MPLQAGDELRTARQGCGRGADHHNLIQPRDRRQGIQDPQQHGYPAHHYGGLARNSRESRHGIIQSAIRGQYQGVESKGGNWG